MQTYELTYIISSEITSEEAESRAREIESTVQNKEGTILNQANPAAKALAYPIESRASGFVGLIEFQMEPEKLPELENVIGKNENIIRHMITIKEIQKFKKERRGKKTKAPASPILEHKAETEKPHEEQKAAQKHEAKEKIELKDIEDKLDEILGE